MEGNQNTTGNSRIALCLSGGGFRATLFHLGVIKALRAHFVDEEMALNQIAEVYAVSGGSILAAHMLKNWDRYTSADEGEFKQVSDELLTFAKRDVRNRVLRRAGLTFWSKKSSTQWLQDEYASKHFLGSDTLDKSYAPASLPVFHFLATNFNSGELCSFSGTEFELTERIEDGSFETHTTAAGSIPLAFAVAASSSFPVAFPPITLTPRALGHPEGKHFQMPIELSDGGVYDNFGIEKFLMALRDGPTPEVLIVSNAGGSFQADPLKSYDAILPRNIRASDVMMRRVGESTLRTGHQTVGDGFTIVRIGGTTTSSQISQTTQKMLRLVRTDLDRFDSPLAELLVDHGDGVARDAFKAKGWQATSEFSCQAPIKNKDAAVDAIEQAAKRGKASFFFDIRDGWWLLAWYVVIMSVGYLAYWGWDAYTMYKADKLAPILAGAIEDERSKTRTAVEPILFEVSEALARSDTSLARARLDKALDTLGLERRKAVQESSKFEGAPPVQSFEPTKYPQRVFIQFAGMLTREQVTSLNTGLRNAGWNTQGGSGERIGVASGLNEVRYSGENREAAQQLANSINSSGLPLAKEVGIKQVKIIGSNDIEVWISR
jgi:predicted acylesterase/phospholipase RssA